MKSRRSVFISATSRGFASWRKTLSEILIAQEIQPLEQTWLTPESEIVQNQIEGLISSATGVICLVGPYYGYPSSKLQSDGHPFSYTQYEWHLATKWNKPRRVFLIEESFFGGSSETDSQPAEPPQLRQWQADFFKTIRTGEDKYPHRRVTSPETLGIELAKINWRAWPTDE